MSFGRSYRWQDIYPSTNPAPMKEEPYSETVGTDTCRYCGQLINTPYCAKCGAPRMLSLRETKGKVVYESHDQDDEGITTEGHGQMKIRRELKALEEQQSMLSDALQRAKEIIKVKP